jgi:hypothetical protein
MAVVATCEVRGINPFEYLADVLARVQDHATSAIDALCRAPGLRLATTPDAGYPNAHGRERRGS